MTLARPTYTSRPETVNHCLFFNPFLPMFERMAHVSSGQSDWLPLLMSKAHSTYVLMDINYSEDYDKGAITPKGYGQGQGRNCSSRQYTPNRSTHAKKPVKPDVTYCQCNELGHIHYSCPVARQSEPSLFFS